MSSVSVSENNTDQKVEVFLKRRFLSKNDKANTLIHVHIYSSENEKTEYFFKTER